MILQCLTLPMREVQRSSIHEQIKLYCLFASYLHSSHMERQTDNANEQNSDEML